MTRNEIEAYFLYQARLAKYELDDIDDFVAQCVTLGFGSFWNAKNWSFRTRTYDLSITSEAESYDLPDDFDGIRTVREQDSEVGNDLLFKSKEEFDACVPEPTAHASSYPKWFTVYKDDGTWKLSAFPVPPSGTTLILDMFTTTPGAIESIPDSHLDGLIVSIERFFYQLGTPERAHAGAEYEKVLQRLEVQDSRFKGNIWKIFDDTDDYVEVSRPWL